MSIADRLQRWLNRKFPSRIILINWKFSVKENRYFITFYCKWLAFTITCPRNGLKYISIKLGKLCIYRSNYCRRTDVVWWNGAGNG